MALNACGALVIAACAPASQPARAETVIAALGDSLTAGYGLPREEGFVPQLERWLEARGAAVRIVNAGVSGDTTRGGLSRADWTLGDDVDGLILALGGNDVLRGLDPAAAKANLGGILAKAREKDIPVLLVGIGVPPNYGAAYQEAFSAIYPDLAAEYGTLLHPDFLGAIAGTSDRRASVQKYVQRDGLHPNAEGVAVIVEDIGPDVLELIGQAGE